MARTRFGSFLVLAVLTALAVSAAGCEGPTRAKVRGKVTLDGSPMPAGQVVFEGKEGTTPVVIPVKNGEYEGEANLGPNKVRISSFARVEPKVKGEPASQHNIVAPRFNTNTELTRDVGKGDNEFDFAVSSK